MVYFFSFSIDGDVVFRTQVHSLQCTEVTKKQTRCKRRCVIGSAFCSTHLAYNHHLKIKQSTLPNAGLGLFAKNPSNQNPNEVIFRTGDKIVSYQGELIDKNELIRRYHDKTPPYVVGISKDNYEDGAKFRGVGALANTKPNHNNATLSVYRGRASLKATKPIHNGEEIFLSYGQSYRINQPGVISATTKK